MRKSILFALMATVFFILTSSIASALIPAYKSWLLNGLNIYTLVASVGIGTANPSHQLEVKAANLADDPAAFQNSEGDETFLFAHDANGNAFLLLRNTSANTKVSINTQGDSYFAGGNVGIGTTTPASKLTVTGTIESTAGGIKYPDGTVQTTALAAGGATFGGTFVKDANTGACLLVNPLTGSCACPSGFSEYTSLLAAVITYSSGAANQMGCYKL